MYNIYFDKLQKSVNCSLKLASRLTNKIGKTNILFLGLTFYIMKEKYNNYH